MYRNPWTKDVECLVANNTIVSEEQDGALGDAAHSYDLYKQSEYTQLAKRTSPSIGDQQND